MSPERFAVACDQYVDQVWRQMRAMGVSENHLDDATQEVFLTAHQKITEFEGRAKLSTWLYAIAYRVGCNYRRKVQRDPVMEANEDTFAIDSRTPEQSLRDKQAAEFVQDFCDSLSEKLRDVFVLCLLEGLPQIEVADLLGVPGNTVSSRVRLARDAFRNALARKEALSR